MQVQVSLETKPWVVIFSRLLVFKSFFAFPPCPRVSVVNAFDLNGRRPKQAVGFKQNG